MTMGKSIDPARGDRKVARMAAGAGIKPFANHARNGDAGEAPQRNAIVVL